MSFKTNKDTIVTALGTLTGAGKPLQIVYGYLENDIVSFPCAMVKFAEGGNVLRLDTASNLLTSKFDIFLLFRASYTLTAYDQVLTVLDSVLDLFNTNARSDTLGGVVEKFTIETIDPMEVADPEAMMGFRVRVSCQEIYNLT
jgi:hypothetical protein